MPEADACARFALWQDFCYLTGIPYEQFAIYKKEWQLNNQQRFIRKKSEHTPLADKERLL